MVFTPPPSPLPPRHPVREPEGEPVTTQNVPPTLSLASSASKFLKNANTRRVLVILVPLLLILIGAWSEIVSKLNKRPVSVHFGDTSLRGLARLDASRSRVRRLHMRHRSIASSYSPPTVDLPDVGGRDLSDTAVSPGDDEAGDLHPARTFQGGVQLDASPTNVAPPIDTNAPLPTPFPQPWDSSLSYNFSSSSCLSFFAVQLANITFRECRPFGLLVGYSSGFFDLEANLPVLTSTLYGTCSTPRSQEQCVSIMDWMSGNMDDPKVCGKDKSQKNSIVLEAKGGFDEYEMMKEAGCLVNNRTNAYCFAEAIANSSSNDAYYYNLPLGIPLPRTTVPSCSTCTQSLMRIYARYAGNAQYDISQTYAQAANMTNAKCGSSYVPVVLTPKRSGASRRMCVFGSGTGGIWVTLLPTFLVLVGCSPLMLFS